MAVRHEGVPTRAVREEKNEFDEVIRERQAISRRSRQPEIRRAILRGFAAVALIVPVAVTGALPVLVLNDGNDPPMTTPEHDGFIDVVAAEVFHRAGAELRLVQLPAERALYLASDGLLDGDITRVSEIGKQFPNLLRVPEPLFDRDFVAFSKNPAIPATFAALRGRSVGIIRGWRIFERNIADGRHVTKVQDARQLFRLLQLDRIEVALYDRSMGQALIEKYGMKDIHLLHPVLIRRPMYIYLYRGHAALVPALAASLKAVKRDGFYARVYREKMQRYMRDERR